MVKVGLHVAGCFIDGSVTMYNMFTVDTICAFVFNCYELLPVPAGHKAIGYHTRRALDLAAVYVTFLSYSIQTFCATHS